MLRVILPSVVAVLALAVPSAEPPQDGRAPAAPAATAPARAPVPGNLADLAWLAGTWGSAEEQQDFEETWSRPVGDSLVGMFRMVDDGKAVFFELMSIEARDGTLVFHLRHFSPGLQPWASEAGGAMTYPLLSMRENEVIFENPASNDPRRFIYRRTGDALAITLEDGEGHGPTFTLSKRG